MSSAQVLRRNLPGTKAADFCGWPDQSFDEMDSTLAVQQLIQQAIRNDYTDIAQILLSPEGQDEGVWKYEHLRQFCLELNGLAVKLQMECSAETCSQMTATEQWIFLCAAHKAPKECPAIDYTRHTLDGAASLLNSNKYFPSRVSIKDSSVAKLGSVCRRVYRIFSHAYYHHRHIFDEFENESHLCRRFTVFVIKYNLMSRDNLIVPILEEPALKAGNDKETSPTFTLATPAQKQEEDPAVELPADDTLVSLALSSTVIEAPPEEKPDEDTAQESNGFECSDGAPNFSTLKINKNAEKAVKEDIESVNRNDDNREMPESNIVTVDEPSVPDNSAAPLSSETA